MLHRLWLAYAHAFRSHKPVFSQVLQLTVGHQLEHSFDSSFLQSEQRDQITGPTRNVYQYIVVQLRHRILIEQ